MWVVNGLCETQLTVPKPLLNIEFGAIYVHVLFWLTRTNEYTTCIQAGHLASGKWKFRGSPLTEADLGYETRIVSGSPDERRALRE